MKSVKVLMVWRSNQVQTSQTNAVSIATLNRRQLRSYDSVLKKNKVYELYLAIFRRCGGSWRLYRVGKGTFKFLKFLKMIDVHI